MSPRLIWPRFGPPHLMSVWNAIGWPGSPKEIQAGLCFLGGLHPGTKHEARVSIYTIYKHSGISQGGLWCFQHGIMSNNQSSILCGHVNSGPSSAAILFNHRYLGTMRVFLCPTYFADNEPCHVSPEYCCNCIVYYVYIHTTTKVCKVTWQCAALFPTAHR